MNKKLISGTTAVIGFILSPASWWNDILVNFPLSLAFAFPFGFISRKLLLPMFILGYWLSNIIGLLLMHYGFKGIIKPDRDATSKKELLKMFLISVLYSLIILALVLTGVLKFPQELIEKLYELVE